MNETEFIKSAAFIVKRNVSGGVVSVVVTFDRHDGRLRVVYCLQSEPCDDDREDCELTCAELIAAFPEVKVAETICVSVAECPEYRGDMGGVVYSRG